LTTFASLLGTIYDIRFEIYQRKFFVKFLNNFIAQLTPFFFLFDRRIFGNPRESLIWCPRCGPGSIQDLASPWKELLDFYQIKEDSRIKYEQIVEQFQPAGLIDARLQLAEPEKLLPLTGELAVANLSLAEDEQQPHPRRGQLHGFDQAAYCRCRTRRQRKERARSVARPSDPAHERTDHDRRG